MQATFTCDRCGQDVSEDHVEWYGDGLVLCEDCIKEWDVYYGDTDSSGAKRTKPKKNSDEK